MVSICSLCMVVSGMMRKYARKGVHGHDDVTSMASGVAYLALVAAAQPAAVYVSCFLQRPSLACRPLIVREQALCALLALSLVLGHVDIP